MNNKIMAGILSIAMVITSLSIDTTNVYASQDEIILVDTAEELSPVSESLIEDTEADSVINDNSLTEDTLLINDPISDGDKSEENIPVKKDYLVISVDKINGTVTVGDFEYKIDDKAGTATVIDWLNTDNSGKAVIPSEITLPDDYESGLGAEDTRKRRVTVIESNAFDSNKEDLKEVEFPTSIESINKSAFNGCSALVSVVLPKNLNLLGTQAFNGCTSLESVTLPDTLKSIGHSVFSGCTKLTSITIPKKMSLEAVDTNNGKAGPFTGADNLKIIKFASNIEEITHDLFSFSNIENISIPDTVTTIENKAFYNCTALTSVSFGNSSKLVTIGDSAFEDCPMLGGIILPKFTNSIGKKAFFVNVKKHENPEFKEASIPDSIKTIGDSAFQGCINLEKVDFTEGDTGNEDGQIGASCFSGCNKLTGIDIPRKIKSIGKEAFNGCSSLATLTLPNGLLTIGDASFFECSSLNELTIPDTVTSIGSLAFGSCIGISKLTLSNKLDTIGKGAFSNCSQIPSVEIPKSLTKVNGVSQTSKQEDGVFYGCPLLKDIKFESGIKSIPAYLFFGHDWLQKINIPSTVTSIGDGAFMKCDILSNAIIPASVETIGNYSFADCKQINNPNGGNLIPKGVKSIGEYSFKGCLALNSVVIPDGVETLGAHAFSGCTQLTTSTLPENIKTIITAKNPTGLGSYCFERCTKLTTVNLPVNLAEIPEGLFYECTLLKMVNLSKNDLTAIGNKAFYNCDAFVSLDNSKVLDLSEFSKLKTIGESSFQECDGIEAVKLSAATTTLGKLVFDSCNSLADISLGTGLATIPEGAFSNILNLKKITIPSNVIAIGSKAFHSDQNLIEVHIPKTTTTLGTEIFSYNKNLNVYGVKGSAIEDYCSKNDITFNEETIYVSKLEFLQEEVTIGINDKDVEVPYKAEPANHTQDIKFESSDTGIFTVTQKAGKVYISAINGGTAKLIASAKKSDDTDIDEEIKVTVRVPVTGIKLDKTSLSIGVGRYETLIPTIIPSTADNKKVIWSSDNESVATVNSSGVVTGISEGVAIITATADDGGKTATCKVTVKESAIRKPGEHEVIIGDFYYLIDDSNRTAKVSLWLNNKGDGTAVIPNEPITLPDDYDTGLPSSESRDRTIVAIASMAFDGSALKSITIPDNIETIEDNAFNNCIFLESIELPSRMLSIGDSVFNGCSTLNHVGLPDKLDKMGSNVFDGCLELKEIKIPQNMDLKTIGNPQQKGKGPFAGNLGLKNVSFENGIEVIPEKLFMGCTSLERITIPDTVSTIGTIKQNGNTTYSSSYSFAYCDNLVTVTISESSRLSKILEGAFTEDKKLSSIRLPEQTILIAKDAFKNCSDLKNATMPNSIGDIEESGFEGCSKLSTVEFYTGDNTKTDSGSIGKKAFYNCYSLSGINIPRRIKEIGEKAFYIEPKVGRSALATLTLPSGLKTIEVDAFNGCCELEKIEIPDTVESIGSQSFMGCEKVTNLTLSKGLTSIGNAAFKNCSEIDKVMIPKSMGKEGSKVTGINYSVKGKDLDKDSSLVNERNKGVFAGCTKLKTIEFESGILGIPDCLFFGADSLNSVTIPDTVTSIGNGAFRACKYLTYITIPESVNSIGEYAFANCHGLKKKDEATEIIPVGNIKTIGSYAFYDCTAFTKIVLPAGIEGLGDHAFDGCTTLKEAVVPDSVKGVYTTKDKKGLGTYCFADCNKLEKVQLPSDLSTVPEGLFKECVVLTSVNLSKDYLTTIGKQAFYNCDAFVAFNELEILDFVDFRKLEEIGEAAFRMCDKIKAVHFSPATVKLGKLAFDSCISLSDIKLSTGLNEIPANAFSNATNLERMVIPANVTSIGDEAFLNDEKLKEIHIPKTTTKFGKDIFTKGNALTIYVVDGSEAHKEFLARGFNCEKEMVYVKSINFVDKQYEISKTDKNKKPYIIIEPAHYSVDITFESSDTKIFTVSKLGEITGVAAGDATLTASAPTENGAKVSATLKVHVRQPVTGVKIMIDSNEAKTAEIRTGETLKLTAEVLPKEADNKNVTWESDKDDYVSVGNDGTIYGKKPGTANIFVTTEDQNKTAKCTVTVKEQQSSSTDFRNEDAKAPVANVTSGSVDEGTVVKLSTETIGASIYYTINGNDPIATSEGVTIGNTMLYAGPIVINTDTTIKAIAVCTGYHNSKVVTFEYKVGDGWGDVDADIRSLFGNDPTRVPTELWYLFDGDPTIYTKSAKTNVEREFTGEKITFDNNIHVFNGKTRLSEKTDYTLAYSNNKALTTSKKAVVKIKGKGNYTGTAQFEFEITKVSLRNAKIVSGTDVTIPVGDALSTVVPEVVCKGQKLASSDYTVEYYRNEVKDSNKVDKTIKAEAGNYFAVVKASSSSGYKDSPDENVLIRAISGTAVLPMSKVQVNNLSVDYKASFKLTDLFDGTVSKTSVKYESTELVYGVDYTVEPVDTEAYPDYPSIGTYVFMLKGTNTGKTPSYDGEKAVTLTIKGTVGKKPTIKCLNTSPIYTGSVITISDLYKKDSSSYTGVTLVDGSYKLVEGQDYTVDLSQAKEFGKFYVYFDLMGKYSGTLKKAINVKQYKLDSSDGKAKLTVSSADYCKTGAIPADINVTFNGKRLREGIDYKVALSNNKNATSKKQPTVKITGKGRFKGKLSQTFTINKRKLSDLKLFVTDQKYVKNSKAVSYMILPKVEDDGKYLTNKEINAYTIKDCSYYNCKDGKQISDSDVLEQGTMIEVRLKVTAAAGSMYTGSGVELIGHYSVLDPNKLFGSKTSVDFTDKAIYFEDGEYVMPVKGTDYNVTHNGKKLSASDYDIIYISKNRFLGTAKVKVAGKGEYGGVKSKTVRVKAKKLL